MVVDYGLFVFSIIAVGGVLGALINGWLAKRKGRNVLRRGVAGTIMGFIIAFILLFASCPIGPGHLREGGKRVWCQSHLADIYNSYKHMMLDSSDQSNAMTLLQFVQAATNRLTPEYFICPSTGHKPGLLTNVIEWTDYVMIPDVILKSSGNTIMAYCPPKNHLGDGGIVLFTDGTVRWVDMADFWNTVRGVTLLPFTNTVMSPASQ